MAAKLKYNGEAFKRHLGVATNDGLKRATTYLWTECRRVVSTPNTRNRKTGEYDNPSKPGEAPRLRTGHGQKHIVMEYDETKIEGRVGVRRNALYMFFLEIGTRHIKRRPWLFVTLMEHARTIGRLAATGGRGG